MHFANSKLLELLILRIMRLDNKLILAIALYAAAMVMILHNLPLN
jgi:hypothetical protein